MKSIIKSYTTQQQKYINFTFHQELPQVNFGTSKIPRCQYCSAYLSVPFDYHQKSLHKPMIKNKGFNSQIQQYRFQCNLCGALTTFPNYLPIKIHDIPQSYKVELLAIQSQFKTVQDRLPTFLLLIDRHYPLLQCLRDALIGILENLDNQYEFLICVYDNGLSFFDLKGDDIEQIRIDQNCLEAILETVSQNNQKFRQNLSILFEYLNQNTTQPYQNIKLNRDRPMSSTYNGVLKLKVILDKFSNFFQNKVKKHKIHSLRIIWFQYLPSPTFWNLKNHNKISVQCFIFNKNPQMLQNLANSVDSLTVLSQEYCIQQLHFTLYQILQAVDNLYYFTAHAKGKIQYSVDLAYPYSQLVRKRSLGLIIRQRCIKNIENSKDKFKKIESKQKTYDLTEKQNVYQVSATFYDPLSHKKYLYVSTFRSNQISQTASIALSRFHLIKRGLRGHMQKLFLTPKSNTAFNRSKEEQEKTPTTIVNQINWIYKDPVKCAELYKAFKKGDINGILILFPIKLKIEPFTLLYAFRSVYIISKLKKTNNSQQDLQKQKEIDSMVDHLNEKAGIYFCKKYSQKKSLVNYQALLYNQENLLFQKHFDEVQDKNPQGQQTSKQFIQYQKTRGMIQYL